MSASRKTLLDWSQGKSETFHWDQHDNTFTIESKEDVEPLLKMAKNMSELEPSKEIRHAACIPKFVLDKSLRERWSPKDWKVWANDPANKMFRTWPGKL